MNRNDFYVYFQQSCDYMLMSLPSTSFGATCLYLPDTSVCASHLSSVFTLFISMLSFAYWGLLFRMVVSVMRWVAGNIFTPTLLKSLYFRLSRESPLPLSL